MFIKYDNKLYRYLNKKEYYKIITRNNEKITEEFYKSSESYVREISTDDTNIQNIFDIQFYLDWDSHLEKVDKTWEISIQENRLIEEKVFLRFAYGLLPGWRAEEQTVSSRYVDINECENFAVIYIYHLKDGERLEEPLRVEEKLTKEEFITKVIQYRNQNI